MLRIAASLLCVSFLAVQTLARGKAGCREEVIAAFRRLNTSGAFAFEVKSDDPKSLGLTRVPSMREDPCGSVLKAQKALGST